MALKQRALELNLCLQQGLDGLDPIINTVAIFSLILVPAIVAVNNWTWWSNALAGFVILTLWFSRWWYITRQTPPSPVIEERSIVGGTHLPVAALEIIVDAVRRIDERCELVNGKTALYWHLVHVAEQHVATTKVE